GGPLTTIAGPFASATNASINDNGEVAFGKAQIGNSGDGSKGILIGNGSFLDTIADDTGAFMAFSAPSLNNNSEVAIMAILDTEGAGIFSGPDALNDSIVSTGDALDGMTIVGLHMGINGFNDARQVVFTARLSDGTEGIYLASPVPLPAAFWLFGSGLLCMVGIVRRKKAA
ncbi:unnamed protein product, partial [marine sediment metagenome]